MINMTNMYHPLFFMTDYILGLNKFESKIGVMPV